MTPLPGDALSRPYLVVEEPGEASAKVVIALLEKTVEALRRQGDLDVLHQAFETSKVVRGASTTLTVYDNEVPVRRDRHD